MTVYADILMLVNFIVDYFLVLLSAKFLHIKTKFVRLVLSAAIGGAFSLYIFLPQSAVYLQILIHILMCAVLSLIAFGFKSFKNYLRNTATLFCVNFAYSGAMIALWLVLKPNGMLINNSVVYFDISPLFLIAFSVVGYFIAVLLQKISKRSFSQNTYCEVTLFCMNKRIVLDGIADTGNNLTDVFGISEILVTEENIINELLNTERQNPTRFRKIPCGTIVGECLLDGYRIERAEIKFNGKTYDFNNPVLAVSQRPLSDVKIIVNPENLN